LPQGEIPGTAAAKPEVFNDLVFRGKAKESSTIHAHKHFGALRIGTLRDHESVAAASWFDADCLRQAARNRKHLNFPGSASS
jgi:hypothetical protein